MMKRGATLTLVAVLALGGCAEMLKSQALKKAEQNCESQGKQFVLQDIEQHTRVIDPIWTVQVTGRCVGPGEPGYQTVF